MIMPDLGWNMHLYDYLFAFWHKLSLPCSVALV